MKILGYLLLATALLADEGSIRELTVTVDTSVVVEPGAAIQMVRSSSTSVQQAQWCVTGGTCDPTAVGGWTIGTDGSNRMVIQSGQGGSALLDVLHVDASGNLTIPSIFAAGTVNATGTVYAGGHVNSVNGYLLNGTTVIDSSQNFTGNTATLSSTSAAALYMPNGGISIGLGITAGGNIAANGYLAAAAGIQVNGVTLSDNARNLSAGSLGTTGGISAGGNISVSAGYFNCALTCPGYDVRGTQVIDGSRNIYGANGTFSGPIAIQQYNFGGSAGILIEGNNASNDWPNLGFSMQNSSPATVEFASVGTQITNSTAGSEAGDLIFSTMTGGSGAEHLRISGSGVITITGSATVTTSLSAGGNLTANGYVGSAGGYQLNGSTIIDSSGDLTLAGSLAGTSLTVTGGISAGANISASAGYFNCASTCPGYYVRGTQVIDGSGNVQANDINSAGPVKIFQKYFGGGAGLLIAGLNASANWPNLGFSTQNTSGVDTVFASVATQITNSTAGSEAGDLIFSTMTGGSGAEHLRISGGGVITITGSATVTTSLSAGGNLTANGYVGSAGGYQLNGSTIIDSSGDLTLAGSLAGTSLTVTGGISAGGNISASAGYFNCASTCPGYYVRGNQVIDGSANVAATAGTFSGQVQAANFYSTSISASALWLPNGGISIGLGLTAGGNISANGYLAAASGIQINGVTLSDNARNLTAGSLGTTGGISAGGNISASAGYFNCAGSCPGYYVGGTQVIDSSRDLVNAASGFFSGSIQTTSSNPSTALYLPYGGATIGAGLTLSGGSLSIASGSLSSYLNISTTTGVFVAQGNRGVTKTCTTFPTVVGGIVTGC